MKLDRNFSRTVSLVSLALALAGCGTRGAQQNDEPESEPARSAANTIGLATVTYGTTAQGLKLTPADDSCGIPARLKEGLVDNLEEPLTYVAPEDEARKVGAKVLKLEITDLLANAGGIYGGPKMVELKGELYAAGVRQAGFSARRQFFLYIGIPRSTCSMVGKVTGDLGGDMAKWLLKPVDGAFLGER